jgi:FkbM family methyltransferase
MGTTLRSVIVAVLKKVVRTAQNYFPRLAEAKNDLYHWSRQTFNLAHDRDFRALALLPRRDDDLFLDVGANRGQSILSIRRYRTDADVISFEPSPALFGWLTERFEGQPGLTLFNFGLSAQAEQRTLYTPRYRGFPYDGLATFSKSGARQYLSADTLFGFDPALLEVGEALCTSRPLDSLGLKPTFIKIDVEGCEHEVLEGGMATLRAHEPVLMVERFYPNPRVAPLLTELGYAEVRPTPAGFQPGINPSENGFWMTPHRLAEQGNR